MGVLNHLLNCKLENGIPTFAPQTLAMKHLLLTLAILLALKAGAQLSLEHTYDGQGYIAHLEFQAEKYAVLEAPGYRCRLYNADHSLYKTVDLPAPAGSTINSLQFITDGLFNTDALIEMSYTYYLISGSSVVYETRIINENSQVLMAIAGASASFVDRMGDSFKYIAWIYDYASTPALVDTKVYALPGHTVTSTVDQMTENGIGPPYPNPASDFVTLQYRLSGKKDGRMLISNAAGKLVRQIELGPDYESVLVSLAGLPAGVYLYSTAGGSGEGRFIVY